MNREEMVARLERFLADRGVTLKCPVCSNDDFSFNYDAEIFQPATNSVSDHKHTEMDPALSCYMFDCDNCGYVLTFRKSLIDEVPAQMTPSEEPA